ncbi:PREDICTED: myb-like protein P isoform X1 [Polistes dominula]|uniref:Myb-like protein P isoform X1 n=1 Tax=Polistes dominula TaxID=743375 RepID=A0ABM1I2X0_POLDO|nr:PREDICTED: myb-like protein P isoform X1 [Polistes dominula]
MAATVVADTVAVLARGDKILVTVESALTDILVVSFVHGAKCFQGALLDATKRGLPCGVQPPEPVPDPDGDKLATIAARFSYFQDRKNASGPTKVDLRRSINPPARYKNARPTVRLRPRQVLCSKCRSICNENSENVDVSRKRKHDEEQQQQQQQTQQQHSQQQQQQPTHQQQQNVPTRRSDRQRCSQQPQKNQKTFFSENTNTSMTATATTTTATATMTTTVMKPATSSSGPDSSKLGTSSLIPKLSRLQPNEISNAMHGPGKEELTTGVPSTYWSSSSEADDSSRNTLTRTEDRVESTDCDSNPSMAYFATPRRLSSSSVESAKIPEEEDKKTLAAADSTMRPRIGRIPRKKRSVGSMEDLWDESVFEDPTRTARTTPIIKISFGAQGEGTVLKIPSKIQDPEYEQETDDPDDAQAETDRDPLELPRNFDNGYDYCEDAEDDGQEQIDPQKQGVKDASAKAAKRALKKAKKEARRKMLSGAVSPARSPCNGSPRYNTSYDPLLYHRRKHKVKHKKKHKDDRKHKNQQLQQQQLQQEEQQRESCVESAGTTTTECQQNWNVLPDGETYTAIKEQCLKQKLSISLKRLNTNAYARCDYPVSNASSGCKSPGASSDELSEQEAEVDAGETAPDFPPQSHPLVMRLAATPVAHCLTANGRRMDVGDVVWGKIHGFPWWPGKVLSITVSCKEDGTSSGPQAHVAWYGSSTSSLMSCDQLSPFLETFKTRYNKKKRGPYKEAIRQAQNEARSQITPNSTSSVLNVCGSPREVNVLS